MTNLELTDRTITQGRALVHAIETLSAIDPSGPIERFLCKRCGIRIRHRWSIKGRLRREDEL